ncbi:MAG TPA: peptidoglycan bridge formation glycyltransferase FemA/FemB family protein [Bacilli bacterium]|mgnify:CR=1 FL=1|nr:peptidoglycan bridge formation glycyltransferase FemA/FemB family protein [Bacilli bacterium]
MKFCVLKEKEYDNFARKNPLISIYQMVNWGELKRTNGWIPHYIGVKEGNKIIAGTLLLEKQTPIKKSLFYAPRGFLLDFNNHKLLSYFTKKTKEYLKNNKGFMLKIDPNWIYQIRDNNGLEINKKDDKTINYLKHLGFKHLGFNKEFENMQPRFLCRFKLQDTYNKTLNTFYKSTVRNIEIADEKSVVVREGKEEDYNIVMKLLDETASRKNFALRTSDYYKEMFKLFNNESKIFIASIDTRSYLNNIENEWVEARKDKECIENKMKREIVGKSLKKQLELAENKLKRINQEIKIAKSFAKESDYIDIGALFSTFIGNEGITFMSGINDNYRKFNPKYAMYNAHIKESLKRKLEYVNFYGISGIFDKCSKNYGIYELKKGFNTEVIELIGEFDLIINKFDYIIYKIALKFYTDTKKIKNKLAK